MTQAELERAVARSTGESVAVVRRRGFQLELPLVDPDEDPFADPSGDEPTEPGLPHDDPWADDPSALWGDDGPSVFDWDRRQAVRLEELCATLA
jgi:hypothetical protein